MELAERLNELAVRATRLQDLLAKAEQAEAFELHLPERESEVEES